MLYRDRRAHARIALLMEIEARLSHEAWVQSMDASDIARFETQVTVLQGQHGPASGPAQPKILEEAGSSSLSCNVVAMLFSLLSITGNSWLKMAPKKTTRSTPATTTTPTTSVTDKQLKRLIDQGVANALAAHDVDKSRNGKDSHDSGTSVRRQAPPARDNCSVENQIKFSTCTLLRSALTWWNSHVKTVGHDVAYAMTWTNLKKKMTDKYCPRDEVKKLETKTMQDAIEFATELMDKKICTFAERQSENKRKQDDNQQQQQNKRQNTGRAYAAGSGEKKPYGGSKPLCSKCNYHHDGQCAPKCHKCNRVGHLARDCRSTANANTANNQRGTRAGQKPTCYECGAQGHFKRECPKLKNNNRGNQGGNGNAPAKVFVSTAFSSQIDITPSTLDHYYDVELADRRIIRLNAIIRGCTLNFLNHPFNIDLMPIELGSFDVIIGMDWLARYQAILVCAEKIVRIPWENETLIVRGDGSDWGNEIRLNIISCTKTQKYMLKGCYVFLAHVTTKEIEDKSEKK
ncbi:putative reverse transcriptase domain-containing protein [Tanacetum coccineum]